MKAYFTASIRLNRDNKEIYDAIQAGTKDARFDFESVYSTFVGIEDYSNLSDEEAFSVFRTAQKSLKEADVVIADVSHPSDRIGYEVATALAEKKPVLALLTDDAKMAPPVQGNKSKFLQVVRYNGTEDVRKKVISFLADAKKKVDTKFILIISPQIDKYLEWASSERRMHKAQVVRDAIEDTMNKDKDYQVFKKQQAAE